MIYMIDIGSNTIRFNVYEETKDKRSRWKEVFLKKNVAGLASYVEDGVLTKDGIKKLIKVLKKQEKLFRFLKGDELHVFATASLRNIKNSREAIQAVEEETGLTIRLFSAEEESKLGYRGWKQALDIKSGASIDIGGGSTELVTFNSGGICAIYPIEEGCLSLYRRFVSEVFPTAEEVKALEAWVSRLCPYAEMEIEGDTLVGIGGTVRALGNMLQELNAKEDNTSYTLAELEDLQARLLARDQKALRTLLQVVPERVHSITPGLLLLRCQMQHLGMEYVQVSKYGVREGYAEYLQTEGSNGTPI